MIHVDGADFVTRQEAAEILRQHGQDVKPETVRWWARDGKITPWATLDGQPYYRLADVYRAERDTRRNARRPRVAA